MAIATTDVREWLREQGHHVGDRGAIRQDLRDLYDDAHPPGPVIRGEVIADGAPGDDDFPYPAADGAADPVTAAPAPPAAPAAAAAAPGTGERRPREVKGTRRLPKWLTGRGRRRRRSRDRAPRVSLGDFAEETWQDLAWLAAPIPPLAAMLELQAPYAGVVLDDQVRGTVIDDMLQPVARYSGAFRALNGLFGPPVAVLMICVDGRRDDTTGEFDTRTKVMFGMLRYSLAQMLKVGELSEDQIAERTTAIAERGAVVDAIVNRLFGLVPAPPPEGSPPPPPHPGGGGGDWPPPMPPRMAYPGQPVMDATGADPGRV